MTFETENIEFKSQFTEEIYKEVIAFANTDGGIVYVGIDNDGNAIGLAEVDQEYTRITNGIRDAIMPDVTMFVRFTIQDNKVVRIAVSEGTNKPYYLKGKGLKPSGVYVRQGTSSVPASSEQIRRMIKESDGDMFEEMRSAMKDRTSSPSFRRRHCCSCFRMARRVSNEDCVICVVTPEKKRETRRDSRPGISEGCLSEVRMICLPRP